MKLVYCDRCDAEMKPDAVGNMLLNICVQPGKPREFDLCPSCSHQVVGLLYSKPEPSPKPVKVEPTIQNHSFFCDCDGCLNSKGDNDVKA